MSTVTSSTAQAASTATKASATSTNAAATTAARKNDESGNSIKDLDLDVFLELMLAELQNQDPLDPMDNNQLLQQISQIREISASDKLAGTLDSVLLGQNVATAAGLIGKEVEGITNDGRRVNGEVRQVAISDGEPILDLAIATSASAGSQEGKVAEGEYVYEVAWQSEGVTFSVQADVNTENLGEDFEGSIRLENLPPTDVPKKVYRTDKSGAGDLKLVGTLASGKATAFVDTLADKELNTEKLTGTRQRLVYADVAKVKLSNVGLVNSAK
ncbi:MAG: flagellar hook assembly protein FlgD [Lacipirellulaceae bacterium]